jgi:preprotein translocase subunit SecF
LIRGKKDETFEEVAERSVNETVARSFGTSFTSLLTLVAIYLFGGETIRYFVLALIIGIGFGTYSSIFLASPLLVFWENRLRKKA